MERVPASFRDPAGFVFHLRGEVFRAIATSSLEAYRRFRDSGLYRELVERELLIPHEEVSLPPGLPAEVAQVIRPRQVPYISYSSEWCFSQLQDAALTTLAIQRLSLEHGFTLKDAAASNIQFVAGRPMLIDTLSFAPWVEGHPWVAYRQFCTKFLAPLALESYRDPRLGRLTELWQAGLPLDLAVRLLPWRSRLRPGLLLHLHAQARLADRAARWSPTSRSPGSKRFSREAFHGLVNSLEKSVRNLSFRPRPSVWSDYYDEATAPDYRAAKQELLLRMLAVSRPRSVWDLGGNTGEFARVAVAAGAEVVCFDADQACVELNYRACREAGERHLLPLLLDLMNPSPARGWDGTERPAWHQRGRPDCVLALALIHHLAIGHGVPLERLADFLARLAPWLIIEFVPKDDPRVRQMLRDREDIFDRYTPEEFQRVFGARYHFERREVVGASMRTLHLLRRREGSGV